MNTMFNQLLEKLAKKRKEEESDFKKVAPAVAAVGGAAAAPLASIGMAETLSEGRLTSKELRRLKKAMRPGIPMYHPKGGTAYRGFMVPPPGKRMKGEFGQAFRGGQMMRQMATAYPESATHKGAHRAERVGAKKGIIVMPKRGKGAASLPAHEMGHARVRRHRIGKHLGVPRAVGPSIGSAGGIGAALLADPESSLSKAAPFMAAAGHLPVLADEALASISAIKGMKKAKLPKRKIMKARMDLAKAFGSYGVVGAATMAVPYAIRKLRQTFGKKKGKQK